MTISIKEFRVAVLLISMTAFVACAHRDRLAGTAPTISASASVVIAAGDIACDPESANFKGGSGDPAHCQMKATSDLAMTLRPAAVLVLGDEQYETGAFAAFTKSYDPSWGRLKEITHPVPGNHEYGSKEAKGYFEYFGKAAGPKERGYYSFDLGNWHLIALNSNCSSVGGCGEGSVQEQWLKQDLEASSKKCTLAYWHNPRFSSGVHGSDASYAAFWRDLYNAHADLVLAGHDHDYERFAPLDPKGILDQQNGIREIVVGTGGKNRRGFSYRRRAHSEFRDSSTFGILELGLDDKAYEWRFIDTQGTVRDYGQDVCHER